jgi:uncharacterized protein YndB with AHSA1/START domain
MPIQTCPTDLVRAPADRIWDLLTIPHQLENWSATRVVKGPGRPLAVGDRLVLAAGFGHRARVYFRIISAERPRELTLEIRLPCGIINHEVIRITPVGPHECRVTYT